MNLEEQKQVAICRELTKNINEALSTPRRNEMMPAVKTVAEEILIKNSTKQHQRKGNHGGGMTLGTEIENLFVDMLEDISPGKFKSKEKVENPNTDSDLYGYCSEIGDFAPLSFKHIGHTNGTQLCLDWSAAVRGVEPSPKKQRTFESAMCIWNTRIEAKRGMWAGLPHGFYIIPLHILLCNVTEFKKNNKSETLIPNKMLTSAMRAAKQLECFVELRYDHSIGENYKYNAWLNNPIAKSKPIK